jgi:hypothetical protein
MRQHWLGDFVVRFPAGFVALLLFCARCCFTAFVSVRLACPQVLNLLFHTGFAPWDLRNNMRTRLTFRLAATLLGAGMALCLLSPRACVLEAQHMGGGYGGFHGQARGGMGQQGREGRGGMQGRGGMDGQSGPHLNQWMERHRGLSPQQQQRALEMEPGFRQLPPDTQQRMRQALSQLNAMPPQQRSHVLQGVEHMEQLSPPQREQVRGALAQLGRLQPDRRRVVGRAFRDLRSMSPAQRQATLYSYPFRRQFTPEEWGTLNGLMSVEPLLPPPPPRAMGMPPPR